MRTATATLRCAIVLAAFGGIDVRADDKTDAEKDLKKFQGTWVFESVVSGGKEAPIVEFKGVTVTFEGDKYLVKMGDEVIQTATIKLDPSRSPRAFDVKVIDGLNKNGVILGIYEISGDTLKACFDESGKERPSQFKSMTATQTLVVHKRVTK